jgi:hypothetical protein
MKKSHKTILIVVALIIILAFFYFSGGYFENYDTSNYKFITKGTCASHNLQDLTNNDCSRYFQSSNYTITGAEHGPPGCWLVLGEMLNQTMNEQPQFAGKGFACWSKNQSDNKQCSSDIPCICKN